MKARARLSFAKVTAHRGSFDRKRRRIGSERFSFHEELQGRGKSSAGDNVRIFSARSDLTKRFPSSWIESRLVKDSK